MTPHPSFNLELFIPLLILDNRGEVGGGGGERDSLKLEGGWGRGVKKKINTV